MTGYIVDIPFAQFLGPGHSLTVHTRVTPQGRQPVYLTRGGSLPEVPHNHLDAEINGSFVVGQGAYRVEVLVADDRHRVCRGTWQIQARPVGGERQLDLPTPSGAVEELAVGMGRSGGGKPGARIGHLTLLLHAAPLSPSRTNLSTSDIERLVDSAYSVIRQLPAAHVRIAVFNLDQRAVAYRKDGFRVDELSDLAAAMGQMKLGLVDYSVLKSSERPIDTLLGLIQGELHNAHPPDALVVLGPRSRAAGDLPPETPQRRAGGTPPIFYLQYGYGAGLVWRRGPPARGGAGMGRGMGRTGGRDGGNPEMEPTLVGVGPDIIERLISRMKAETVPIYTPLNLAEAIRRMDARLVRNGSTGEMEREEENGATDRI